MVKVPPQQVKSVTHGQKRSNYFFPTLKDDENGPSVFELLQPLLEIKLNQVKFVQQKSLKIV